MATGSHAQNSGQSNREHKGPRLVLSSSLRGTGRGVPLHPATLDPGQPPPSTPLCPYLVTSRAARPQQLCVMTAAVEKPVVVEADEIHQGLAADLAGKASWVPAAPLSCTGSEHSVLPGPQPLPALRGEGGWAGWSEAAPRFPPGSSIPIPTSRFSPYPWQARLHCRLHQEPLNLASLFQVCQTVNPQPPFPHRSPWSSPLLPK